MTDNSDQRSFWSDIAGASWVAQQGFLDGLLRPVLDLVLDRTDLAPGQRVLDIGCGTGASCLAAADRVGESGHVLGVDISPTLLDLARERAAGCAHIELIEADAAAHPFESADRDHLISRFGVMFFTDPVAAFANMAHALRPGARVVLAAWGRIPENPYFTEAAAAATDVLGQMPRPEDPYAPSPFAFRDSDRVVGLLRSAGLATPSVEVIRLDLTPPGALDDVVTHLLNVGAAEAAMRHFEADPAQRDEVAAGLRARFARFETTDGLRIPAEINLFTASRA